MTYIKIKIYFLNILYTIIYFHKVESYDSNNYTTFLFLYKHADLDF